MATALSKLFKIQHRLQHLLRKVGHISFVPEARNRSLALLRVRHIYMSQLSVTQNNTAPTNGKNNASKAKKLTHSTHLRINLCKLNTTSANEGNLFTYFHITYMFQARLNPLAVADLEI